MSAAPLPVVRHSAPTAAAVPRRSAALPPLVYSGILLVTGIAGLLLIGFGPAWLRPLFPTWDWTAPSTIIALLAATAASIALHEMGHLLAAVWLDFEILAVSLGPVRVQWLHGKYATSFSAKRLFMGSVSAVPKDMRNWRQRTMWVTAAGPLASLAAATAALTVAIIHPASGFLQIFWCALAQLNLLIFVLGLAPNNPRSSVRNDAALFRMLLFNGPDAQEFEAVQLIAQLKLHAIRPVEYPRLLMHHLAACPARRPDTRALVAKTLSDWALDSGDIRLADYWDRKAVMQVEDCNPRLRNSVIGASACFDVLFRDDVNGANAKLAKTNLDELFPPCLAHRVRAVRWLALGLPRQAPAEVIRAQYSLPLGMDYYDFERMLLEKIHLKALLRTFSGEQNTLQ